MALSAKRLLPTSFMALLYACATLQFVRYYARTTDFYLKMPLYLSGHERMPFQERVLPILLLRPIFHSHWIMSRLVHANGVADWNRAPFYLISALALGIAAIATQMLYRRVSQQRTLGIFVFPIFLFTVMWTYTIHNEVNFSYPYDFISLAFFTLGLLFIYSRQYLPLLVVMLIGTLNRETTLFLIGIYLLDAASVAEPLSDRLRDRFSLKHMPWLRAAALLLVWVTLKAILAHVFRANDESENYVRIAENAHRLQIRLLPAMLNICGYLFPVVLIYWRQIRPVRFGNYVWIAVMWLPIMFYTGVILETRIYGELCSLTAVSFVLIAEQRARRSVVEPIRQPATLPVPPTGFHPSAGGVPATPALVQPVAEAVPVAAAAQTAHAA